MAVVSVIIQPDLYRGNHRYVQCKRDLHVYSWLLNIIYIYRVRCIYVPKSSKQCILLVVHVFHIECMIYLNLLQINIFLFSILRFVWTLLESVLYIRMIRRYYSRNLCGSIYYMYIYSLWVIVSYNVESLNPWNIRFMFVFSITEWLNACPHGVLVVTSLFV